MTSPLRLLTPLLLAAALGACAATPEKVALEPRTSLDTWTQRVTLEAQPDEVRLAVHDAGLSGNQARALSELFTRWAAAEGGEIVIQSPTAGAAGAYRTGVGAQDYLIGQGVPAGQVRLVGYDAPANAPIIVSFTRYTAVVPQCGAEWGNLSSSFSNKPYDNFGCAVSSNLAAQVANPADLKTPRAMSPIDAQRRDTVMGKYRAGEATAAAKEAGGVGAISTAVQ